MPPEDPAATTPAEAPPASTAKPPQGNLWTDFLRRNLLLAGFASATALRKEAPPAEEPPAKG